jgi:hypothetical protein
MSATSALDSGSSSFGICGSMRPRIRCRIRLRALLPGRMTAPSSVAQ